MGKCRRQWRTIECAASGWGGGMVEWWNNGIMEW